jgi:hypothetical protein
MSDILSKEVKASPDLVTRNNQDGTIILMKLDESNVFFKIEGVAAEVWKGISLGEKPLPIIQRLLTEYEVSEDNLRGDVTNLLHELQKRDLIQVC